MEYRDSGKDLKRRFLFFFFHLVKYILHILHKKKQVINSQTSQKLRGFLTGKKMGIQLNMETWKY
ncbi:TPA: hypothetical protein DCZ39_07805 [Patescibacteria group bacterium]|nr:hypothetical protein [Candidatus Gracilibacteria bacterium]